MHYTFRPRTLLHSGAHHRPVALKPQGGRGVVPCSLFGRWIPPCEDCERCGLGTFAALWCVGGVAA